MFAAWFAANGLRVGFYAVLVAALVGFGAFQMHKHDSKAYDELEIKDLKFRADTAAAGEQQEKITRAKIASDANDKEQRDAQHVLDVNAAFAAGQRLYGDRASGGYLPPSAAASSSGDGACFNGADVERALQRFDAGTQALIDEGTAAQVGLDAVKRRAQKK